MTTLSILLLCAGLPLFLRAWRSLHGTSMRHALAWTAAAWLMWMIALASGAAPTPGGGMVASYLALCLTACAGVAVLGARQPGVQAWNFVVCGLGAALLLPVAQTLIDGRGLLLDSPRLLFLVGALAVGWMNYLPTRLLIATALVGGGCLLQLAGMNADDDKEMSSNLTAWGYLFVALAPWAAWLQLRRGSDLRLQTNRLWLAFRDRQGSFWGLRVREQFNRSAQHAGLNVQLGWFGLISQTAIPPATDTAAAELLRSLLKRFGLTVERRAQAAEAPTANR